MRTNLKNQPLQYIFLLSEFNHSNQFETILQSCVCKEIDIEVIYIGEKSSFYTFLQKNNIPTTFISVKAKKIFQLFTLIRALLWVAKNKKMFVSGQRASSLALIVTFFLRFQFVVWRHHSDLHKNRNLFVPKLLDRLLCFRSRKLLAVTPHHKRYLTSQERLPREKIDILWGGFDVSELLEHRRSNLNGNFHRNNQQLELKFGVCSRVVFEKGIQYVVAAFSEFLSLGHTGRLIIRGEGPYKGILLRNLPVDTLNQIEFMPRVQTPLDFYSTIDVFIHVPINEYTESLGMVYLEGMASGIPCIFTKSGVLNDLPQVEGYVQIVPFCDSKAILESMIKISETFNTTSQSNPYPANLLHQFSLSELPKRFRGIDKLFD